MAAAAAAVPTTQITGLDQFVWPDAWSHPQFPRIVFFVHSLTCKDIHGSPIRIASHVSNYILRPFIQANCQLTVPVVAVKLVESDGIRSWCSEDANKDHWKDSARPPNRADEDVKKISFGTLPLFQDASGEWLCVLQASFPRQTEDETEKCDPLRAHQRMESALNPELQSHKNTAVRGLAEKSNNALVLKESDLDNAQCLDEKPNEGAIYWVNVQGDTATWLKKEDTHSLESLHLSNKSMMIDRLEKEEPGDGQTNEERLRDLQKTQSLRIFRLKDLLQMIHDEASSYS